jgi:hypothetical protein
MTLHRYWFKFALGLGDPHPAGVLLGCGVTAYNYDDALQVLRERVFVDQELPEIVEKVEDVDVSSLDPGHVLPNMRSPTERGVWFPRGFE